MSIYATLWRLQFPRHGDAHVGCEWVEVVAQGVPAHVGTPTPGYGYESGDPYETFLPPALRVDDGASEDDLRAVVFVISMSKKGTSRSGQEYESPLLVLTGAEYAATPFQTLHDRLCDALRGDRPRLVLRCSALIRPRRSSSRMARPLQARRASPTTSQAIPARRHLINARSRICAQASWTMPRQFSRWRSDRVTTHREL